MLAIHGTLLARLGGPAGVRDYGLLESALSWRVRDYEIGSNQAYRFLIGQMETNAFFRSVTAVDTHGVVNPQVYDRALHRDLPVVF